MRGMVICALLVSILSGCGTTRKDVSEGMKVGGAANMVTNPLGGVVYMTGVLVGIGADSGPGGDVKRVSRAAWGEEHGCSLSHELVERIKAEQLGEGPKILTAQAVKACDLAVTKKFDLPPETIKIIKRQYRAVPYKWVSIPIKSMDGSITLDLSCKKDTKDCTLREMGVRVSSWVDYSDFTDEIRKIQRDRSGSNGK